MQIWLFYLFGKDRLLQLQNSGAKKLSQKQKKYEFWAMKLKKSSSGFLQVNVTAPTA